MDKFGIFDLLDTLSQIASDAAPQEKPTEPPPVQRVSPDDKAFLPPEFPDGKTKEDAQSRNALSSFYEKHSRISSGIDKRK